MFEEGQKLFGGGWILSQHTRAGVRCASDERRSIKSLLTFYQLDATSHHDMSTARPCLAQLSRICLYSNRPTPARISARSLSTTAAVAARGANARPMLSKAEKAGLKKSSSNPQKNKKKGEEVKKKKKARTTYQQYDQRDLEQFTLLEAMR